MAKCPYCEKNVFINPSDKESCESEVLRESIGRIKFEVMYSCPHCDKVLGFAYFRWGILSGNRP